MGANSSRASSGSVGGGAAPGGGSIRQSRIRSINLDDIFSYSTVKIVKIRDRRIGALHLFIQLAVIAYIIGYVFIYNKGYLKKEESYGLVATKVLGTAYGHWNPQHSLIFADEADLVVPPIDTGGVFIATKYQTTLNQVRGWCPLSLINATTCTVPANSTDDPVPPTSTCYDSSMPLPGRCEPLWNSTTNSTIDTNNGYNDNDDDSNYYHYNNNNNNGGGTGNNGTNPYVCKYFQWCPAEDITDTVNNVTTSTSLEGVGNFTIWFKATINFPSIDNSRFFSTIQQDVPIRYADNPKKANLFTLNELLAMAGTTIDEVKDRGCILKVEIGWDCNLNVKNDSDSCHTSISVLRLDNPKVHDGFNFRSASYYYKDAVKYRDLLKMYGVRMFVTSKGSGYKIDFVAIMLQLSSGVALLGVATVVADFMIVYVLPQKHYYKKYKFRNTPDIYDIDEHKISASSFRRVGFCPPTKPKKRRNTRSVGLTDDNDAATAAANSNSNYGTTSGGDGITIVDINNNNRNNRGLRHDSTTTTTASSPAFASTAITDEDTTIDCDEEEEERTPMLYPDTTSNSNNNNNNSSLI